MHCCVGLIALAVHGAWAGAAVDVNKAQVLGSGSTLLSPLFEAWSDTFNKENSGVNLTYDPSGSQAGLTRLMRNESHWAASDAPLQAADFDRYPGLQQFPLVLSSLALVHDLLDADGARVRVLSLDRAAIARIYSFDILWWDDPALVALNPDVRMPHRRINVVVRGDSSGSSAIMTRSLVSFGWLDTPGCRHAGSGCGVTTHLYRATPGAVGLDGRPLYHYDTATGSSGLARHVADTLWSIGYVGVSQALQYSVPAAVVYNRKGRPTVANRDFTLLSGASATLDLDKLSGDAHDQEGYPIVGYAYLMLWHRPDPSRQFDTVEPEYKGYTKDYKQAVDSGVAPNGRNWGWGAGHQLHLPGKTCTEFNYLYQFIYWLMHSVEARVVVADVGMVAVPLGVANRALARLMEAECGDAHWTTVKLVKFGVRNDLTELLVNEAGHVYNTPREEEGHEDEGGEEHHEGHEEEGHAAGEEHEDDSHEGDKHGEEGHGAEGSAEEHEDDSHEEDNHSEEGHGTEGSRADEHGAEGSEEEGHEDDSHADDDHGEESHGAEGSETDSHESGHHGEDDHSAEAADEHGHEAGGHDDAGHEDAADGHDHGHAEAPAGAVDHEPTVLSSRFISDNPNHNEAVLLMLPSDMSSSGHSDPDRAVPLSGYIPIPVAMSGIALVYHPTVQNLLLPLELPMATIRGILTGNITRWRHPTILDNNRYIPVPDLDITICAHATSLRELLIHFHLDALGPTVHVMQRDENGELIQTHSQVAAAVQRIHGLLGVVPLMTALSWDLSQVYPILVEGTGGLRPSFEIIEETARDAKWVEDLSAQEHGDNVHHLHYPFWHVLWLYVREESTATGEEEEELRAAFAAARWLAGAVSSTRQEVSAETALRSVQYMSLGTCCGLQDRILELFRRLRINGQVVFPEHTDEEDVLPLWLILVLSGVGAVLIGIVLFMLHKNFRDAKNIKRLRSSNAIAERSAVAIAEMRLEEMDYLWEIEHPNRLQRAFMAIVSSLKEYRRYLPQSCLPTVADDDDDEDDTASNTTGSQDVHAARGSLAHAGSVRSLSTSLSGSLRTSHPFTPGSGGGARVQAGGALRAEPRQQQVALLCTNRGGFLSAPEMQQPAALAEWMARSMAIFVDSVGKGVVDNVNGDHCFASFGAAKPCPNRRVAATRCAWKYVEAVAPRRELALPGSCNTLSTMRSQGVPSVTSAVVSGAALCGDFGTSLLRFMTVGGIYNMLQATERLASQWGSRILMDASTHADVTVTFSCRLISAVCYGKRGWPGPVLLWEALAPMAESNAEWMYVVDQGCAWKVYNDAMELWLRSGATEEAAAAATAAAQAGDTHVAAAAGELTRTIQAASSRGSARPPQYKVVELTVQEVTTAWE
eukprot:TRINITY_DN945_c0_g1_i1.p1 TRINITY_DN945_c0_g1~~TRINITY_DN945_c0_g1_i1.p1  ORF type:complete len:1377 (+),score=275.35 TRINITY_DN945_c0_g1_i1:103-4233(+)